MFTELKAIAEKVITVTVFLLTKVLPYTKKRTWDFWVPLPIMCGRKKRNYVYFNQTFM